LAGDSDRCASAEIPAPSAGAVHSREVSSAVRRHGKSNPVAAATSAPHSGAQGGEPREVKVQRYYFHLTDGHVFIPDEVGIHVADLEEARAQAIKAIRELRREGFEANTDWSDWRIEVTDARGAVAFTIDLGRISGDTWEQ
jgi:uncharacterized protein DUF6894